MALEISDHFEQISKKYLELGNLLSKSGDYWESAEKYFKDTIQIEGLSLSENLKYLKAACLSSSSSLMKPVELFKTNIHHFSRNNRKSIEPLSEMMALRLQLTREYNEEIKKLVSAGDAEFDKNKKVKNVGSAEAGGAGQERHPALQLESPHQRRVLQDLRQVQRAGAVRTAELLQRVPDPLQRSSSR